MTTRGLSHLRQCGGFTLVELMAYAGVTAIIGVMALYYMSASMTLFAKNVTTNFTNNACRHSIAKSLDRVQTSVNFPVLIAADGTPSGSPAAGIYYDRLLGDPYVVTNPGGSGLPAGTTTITLTRSTNAYASPPVPESGDVLLIAGARSGLRPMVSSVSVSSGGAQLQTIATTLTSGLASEISWPASQTCTAQLVRREALIVQGSGTQRELRCYPSFEITPNLNDANWYYVVSKQVGSQGTEPTPFSIVTSGSDSFLSMDYVVRAGINQNYLANKEASQFSGYQHVQTNLPLRLRPSR
jgi:type II secretory pathway pseudopilin PulG